MNQTDAASLLRAVAAAATDAARTERIASVLPERPRGRTVVIGAGKAAAAMAAAFETAWNGPLEGAVVTRYGHEEPCRNIEILSASHPVPDENSVVAARRMLELVAGLTADDLVVALISGGGSALMTLPAEGLSLDDLKAVNRALLASGADITVMNCLRKHVSAITGGRLAVAAYPARVVTIAISDVPGDDPAVIASGPTVPDPSTLQEARDIVARYRLDLPPAVLAHLQRGEAESPKPDHPAFRALDYRFIARPIDSLRAAQKVAETLGIKTLVLGDTIEGESREVARVHLAIARSALEHGVPSGAPLLILSGGETTVTLRGKGRGGRNSEFALALAAGLSEWPPALARRLAAIAVDTDGIDGVEDNAGAMVLPDTLERAGKLGLVPRVFLDNNDSYSFFKSLGDLVVTGPTRTNVNDIRAVLVLP